MLLANLDVTELDQLIARKENVSKNVISASIKNGLSHMNTLLHIHGMLNSGQNGLLQYELIPTMK